MRRYLLTHVSVAAIKYNGRGPKELTQTPISMPHSVSQSHSTATSLITSLAEGFTGSKESKTTHGLHTRT